MNISAVLADSRYRYMCARRKQAMRVVGCALDVLMMGSADHKEEI
jgi:hypothetical protein